jgi:DNA-binding protein Fis
MVMAHSIGQDQ